MKLDTGINDQDREKLAQPLAKILANTYVLFAKTQGFHWNVKGSNFYLLHKMFEEQYDALQEAIDPLAERLRALGYSAPGSLHGMLKLATIQEQDKVIPPQAMVAELLDAHESISRQIHSTLEAIEGTGDGVTADLLTERLAEHEKISWMLRATLEE